MKSSAGIEAHGRVIMLIRGQTMKWRSPRRGMNIAYHLETGCGLVIGKLKRRQAELIKMAGNMRK